jgi:intracellular multiplication protein IcmD
MLKKTNLVVSRFLCLCLFFGSLWAPFAYPADSPTAASAASDIGGIASNLSTAITSVSQMIIQIGYIAGLALILAAIFQFKAHKDNPTQVPLSKGIVLLCVGSALVFLPKIFGIAGKTIFGAGTKTDSGSGGTW